MVLYLQPVNRRAGPATKYAKLHLAYLVVFSLFYVHMHGH